MGFSPLPENVGKDKQILDAHKEKRGKDCTETKKEVFFIGEKEQYSVETVANVFENVSLASFFSLRFDK